MTLLASLLAMGLKTLGSIPVRIVNSVLTIGHGASLDLVFLTLYLGQVGTFELIVEETYHL